MLIDLLVLLILAVLVYWIIQQFPLPGPIAKIILVVFVVIVCLALIDVLMGGGSSVRGLLRR